MNIIFLLIPLSLVLLAVATAAFFWAMKHDQFDDMDGPAYSIFNEEDSPGIPRVPPRLPVKKGDREEPRRADGHSDTKDDKPQ